MPRVSQEYRDARRAQILAGARRCFVRDGFHGTSMQDLLTEVGLSSGAVYRYFPGKRDMIVAIAEENLAEVAAEIRRMTGARPQVGIGEVLAGIFQVIRERHEQDGFATIAVLVWAESLRDPGLAERIRSTLSGVTAELTELVRERQEQGVLPAGVPPEQLTQVIVAAVPGYILQLATLGPVVVEGLPGAVRALWPD
ncbi:TetR/AcrR family transcriptional regulator [Actinacidiphila rubida]|uniref:Transcriptional regulator, TetR family n=1 Tax=Actinacidiphila rubida TaxID=310780 RepID=A0A1H8KIS3_9ACTN|nr:TetR/AcrR family transcriptional regulator [Actinacidiphila rubida]SEN92880.1 transcriptional regulator, TetR family [Actinacidiphila rubida]